MMRFIALTACLLLVLAGCAATPPADDAGTDVHAPPPYTVPERLNVRVLEEDRLIPMPDGTHLHARVLRPDVAEPVPVVAEFTIYNAVGEPTWIDRDDRPAALATSGAFVNEILQRGYAFAYVDVRGASGSEGCVDLRGSKDIEDAYHVTEYLSQLEYATGRVAFIGASYPGSMAHIAGIANGPGLAAVVPVVASTSFYHYHHMGGVPYSNVATNPLYSVFGLAPNLNPQHPTAPTRLVDSVTCPYHEYTLHGATKDGTMTDWWADRDLRPRVDQVEVPVLLAHGLQDWNVKPDHNDHYFNDLKGPKLGVFGQFAHQWPPGDDNPWGTGVWWETVVMFLDEHLKDVPTGIMDGPVAWVQDSRGDWHGRSEWPPRDPAFLELHLDGGSLSAEGGGGGVAEFSAGPLDAYVGGGERLVYRSAPLEEGVQVSGAVVLDVLVESQAHGHVVVRLWVEDGGVRERISYGYQHLGLRGGLEGPAQPFDGPEQVHVRMHPQEDVVPKGSVLVLEVSGTDGGSTLPPDEPWTVRIHEGGSVLLLPLRPV